MEIPQVLEDFTIQPLRFVDDEQPDSLGQRRSQDAVGLNRTIRHRRAEPKIGVQLVTQITRRGPASESGARPPPLGLVGERLVDRKRLANAGRTVDGAHGPHLDDILDQIGGIEELLGGDRVGPDDALVMAGHHSHAESPSLMG